MAKERSPQKRERKKQKKENALEGVNLRENRSHYVYDPPKKMLKLTDSFIIKVINSNAILMHGVGSYLHHNLRAFPKKEFRRLWETQQGRCAVSDIQLYNLPQDGPGGIGIDLINYKRPHKLRNNIRLVSSFIAYTRHIKKVRRFTIQNKLDLEYASLCPIFDAIWAYLFKALKNKHHLFKHDPVTATIVWQMYADLPMAELIFSWKACLLNDENFKDNFCVFRLVDDYLESVPKTYAWSHSTHDYRTIKKWHLADPNLDLVQIIVDEVVPAYRHSIKKHLSNARR